MSRFTMSDDMLSYFEQRYWSEDGALTDARARFTEVGPLIEVPQDTGAFLETLVRVNRASRVLEIGTLFGYSACRLAKPLPSGGTLDTIEMSDAHADFAQDLFKRMQLDHVIQIHRGRAEQVLAKLNGPYDLAFIDADKESYRVYLDECVRLVRTGGTIVIDNVAMSGRVVDAANSEPAVVAMREFHDKLASDDRVFSNVVPVGDGVAICIVR